MKKTKCLLNIAGKGRICPGSSEMDKSLVPSLRTIGKRWLWRRPATPYTPTALLKTCSKRNRLIRMEGIVRWRPAIINRILAS